MKTIFLRQAYKFIKRADKDLKNKIKEEILKIEKDSSVGKRLKGKKFKGVFSHRFVFAKVNYRIAYKLVGGLIIISIASRENFYKDLKV